MLVDEETVQIFAQERSLTTGGQVLWHVGKKGKPKQGTETSGKK